MRAGTPIPAGSPTPTLYCANFMRLFLIAESTSARVTVAKFDENRRAAGMLNEPVRPTKWRHVYTGLETGKTPATPTFVQRESCKPKK